MYKNMHMNFKTVLVCSIILFFQSFKVVAQSEFDFSKNNIILRLSVAEASNNHYKFKISPVINGGYDNIKASDEVLLIGFEKDEFNIVVKEMIDDITSNLKQDIKKVTGEDSIDQIQKIQLYNDTIDSIKKHFVIKITNQYDKIKLQVESSKMYDLLSRNTGLTSEMNTQHDTYLKRLSVIQDEIKLIRKIINKFSVDTTRDNKSDMLVKEIKISEEIVEKESTQTFMFPKTPVNIQDIDTRENQIEGYLQSTTETLVNKLDTLLLKQTVLKKSIIRIDNQRDYNVHLIGDAKALSSFKKNSDASNLNAGFGILAVRPGFSEFVGIITIAQAFEDTTSDYGSSILVPGIRRFSLLTRYRTYSMFKYHINDVFSRIGFALDVNVTPLKWVNKANESINVVPIAINVMMPYTWIQNNKKGEDYAISTDVGFAFRSIAGSSTNDQIKSYLGVKSLPTARTYVGPVMGINIKYNALRVQFHAPFLITKNEHRVQGLTNGQVYASIGIIANLTGDIGKYFRKEE